MTKKILGIIFSIITVAILGFSITWSVINFDKVKKAFSGAELYTHEEMLEYGENQYNQGIQDKQDYVDLINDYRDTITTLQDSLAKANYSLAEKDNLLSQKTAEINNLNSNLNSFQNELIELRLINSTNTTKITELETKIEYLNNQVVSKTTELQLLNEEISNLKADISYYETFIAQLESETEVVATFEYNGKILAIQILNKGSYATCSVPADTEYLTFNYFMVDNKRVDLNTYPVNKNTTFVANLSKSYDIKFMVEEELYFSDILAEDTKVTLPSAPTKTGYDFIGWSTDGGSTLVDFNTYLVTGNVTFTAVFQIKTYTVTYYNEDIAVNSQSVEHNSTPTEVNIENTERKVFIGWSLDKVNVVDTSTKLITSDTNYFAVFEYYYSVTYIVNNVEEQSVLYKQGTSPSMYIPKESSDYTFKGWTLDGSTIIDSTTIVIEEDIELIASLVLNKFAVTITNSNAELLQNTDNNNIGYYGYKYYTDLSDYTFEDEIQPFYIGLSLTINAETPININISDMYYNYIYGIHRYHYNYYPVESDSSTHYDISLEIYSGYIRFSVSYYNGTDLNDYGFNVTLNMEVC